jgi:arylsulfatase A-like enzyme
VHGALALALGGRVRNRPWALALLVLPAALGTWPAVARWGGGPAAAGVIAAAAVLVALASLVRVPGRPLPAAALGAALGTLVTAALSHYQLEAAPLPRGAWGAALLWGLGLLAAAVLLGADRWLRLPGEGALPHPRAALLLALAAIAGGVAAGRLGAPPLLPAAEPYRAAAGRGAASPAPPPPVVLIVLDTVRADHLRSYGYGRDTMPRLERFARRHGVRVERAVSVAPSSLEAHASMLTGLLPHRHGARKPGTADPRPPAYAYPLRPGVVTLAQLLRRAGAWPVALSANFGPLAPDFGLDRGFAIYQAAPGLQQAAARRDPFRFALDRRWPLAALDRLPPFAASEFFELSVPYRRASRIVDEALAALDRAGETPVFLFLNFLDAHSPYRPPRRFDGVFPGIQRPGLRALPNDTADVANVMTGRRPVTAGERAAWIAAYDSELRYLDGELGRLLSALERHPRFADTLVIVTSDHGEGFGEHGAFRHSVLVYEEMLRVPLFIKPGRRRPPEMAAGATLPGPWQPTDFFPTVLDHAGLPVPAGLDGFAWGRGRTASFAASYLHLAAKTLHRRYHSERWAVEEEGWKLIVASDGKLELFDLAADPGEQTDLAAAQPARVRRLRARLAATGLTRPPGDRTGGDGDKDGELERSLRSLGYVQ